MAPITILRSRNPCQGYPSAEFDIDTLYYQWVPFFLLFQVIKVSQCPVPGPERAIGKD